MRIINSLGIAKLRETIDKVQGLGGKTAFCCVSPTISKTFGIMGLLVVAGMYDTEGQAVASMGDSEGEA